MKRLYASTAKRLISSGFAFAIIFGASAGDGFADDWQVASSAFQLKPTHVTNKCVDIPGGVVGSIAQQWACFSPVPNNQAFELGIGGGTYSSGGYILRSLSTGGGFGVNPPSNGARIRDSTGVGVDHVWRLPALADGRREIRNYGDNSKCVDVEGASTSDGGQLQLWPCSGSANQRFHLVPKHGYKNIRPVHSGKCLDVEGVSTNNGAQIKQWDCLGASQHNQQWMLVPITHGYGLRYQIVARNSGKCLDVEGASHLDGAKIKQWECLGSSQANQLWQAVWVGKNSNNEDVFQVKSHVNKCLDIEGASTSNAANLQQYACQGSSATNQLFYLTNP